MNEITYRIKILRQFRILEARYDNPGTTLIKEDNDIMVYTIGNDELIKDALEMEVIEQHSTMDMPRIYSPDDLRSLITSVDRNVYDSGHVEYYVHTKRGCITLKTSELLKPTGWSDKLFEDCMVMLSFNLKTGDNAAMWIELMLWIRTSATDKAAAKETQHDVESGIIMEKLQTIDVVDNRDELTDVNVLDESHVFIVRSSLLKSVVETCGYKLSSHTYKVLEQHLVSPSKQMMLCGKQVSVWRFTPW